jgi:hypothetical protein
MRAEETTHPQNNQQDPTSFMAKFTDNWFIRSLFMLFLTRLITSRGKQVCHTDGEAEKDRFPHKGGASLFPSRWDE